MSNHSEHQDQHSNEKKPVAFTVPLIFASVVVLAIVLLVSLGDPGHGCECKETCSKECMEKCEKGDYSMCEENDKHGKEAHGDTNAEHIKSEDTAAVETPVPSATSETATATETAAPAPTHLDHH